MLRGTCLFVFLYACGWVHFYLLHAFTFSWVVTRALFIIIAIVWCFYRPGLGWRDYIFIYFDTFHYLLDTYLLYRVPDCSILLPAVRIAGFKTAAP